MGSMEGQQGQHVDAYDRGRRWGRMGGAMGGSMAQHGTTCMQHGCKPELTPHTAPHAACPHAACPHAATWPWFPMRLLALAFIIS